TAIVYGDNANAMRKLRCVQLIYGDANAVENFTRILATAHQHDAFHAAGLLVDPKDARLKRGADLHGRDIFEEDGHTSNRRQNDVFDMGRRVNQAHTANDHGLLAIVDHGAPGVPVIGADGLSDLVDGEVVLFQFQRVDLDLILFDQSAKRDNVRHSRHL